MISKDWPVVVIGGGTAGCAAAFACAQMGVKTLLVERQSFLGGTSTGGQVTPMMFQGCSDSSPFNLALKNKLAAEGYGACDNCGNDGWFNPEMLKFTLEELLMQSGCTLLYNADFIEAQTEGEKISGITIASNWGKQRITGSVFVDATADAAVAASAGAKCLCGDEKNENQAMSLRFLLANVNIPALDSYLREIGEQPVLSLPLFELCAQKNGTTPFSRILKSAVADGLLKEEDCTYFQAFSVPGMPGVLSFNCPRIPNCRTMLDPAAVTEGLIVGRQIIKRLLRFLKKAVPGFENSFLISTAQLPGVRESRRIRGRYLLTAQDYAARARFADAIARTAYPVDVHGSNADTTLGIAEMERGEYLEIPYRCLVSADFENLLACGRCISSDFIVQSAIRIQPTCRATGEAAGIAAALSIQKGLSPAELDGRLVREIMRKNGGFL